MNRLNPPAGDGQSRKYATDKVQGQPCKCSFCGDVLEGRSTFTALSMDSMAAMCSACIFKFSIMNRLGLIRGAYMDPAKESAIVSLSRRALMAEPGTTAAKEAAVVLVKRMVRRSASLFAGWRASGSEVDPNTKESLAPLRVAVVGAESRTLLAAALAAGLPTIMASLEECLSGEAWKRLSRLCMNDKLMLEHGLMVVSGGVVTAQYDCSMAFVNPPGIPVGTEVVRASRQDFEAN
jgi:hypothetical protein